jgi:TRAP transporter TAXI family solute receptor
MTTWRTPLKYIPRISQALLLVLAISACSPEEPPILTIGTGGSMGNYDKTGLAIARVVNNEQETLGFALQPKESAGSVSNIDAIVAGEIEFGIAQADRQYQAVKGLAEWKNKGPQKELRAVLSLYTESVTLIAGLDSDIRTIHDVKGKRVDIGLPGSGIRQNAIDALNAAEIDWEKDIKRHEEKLDDRLAMLMHSELDALFQTIGHPSQEIRFATYSVRGARFIPLANIDILLATHPYYSKSVISVDAYPRAGNAEDVATVGVKATLLTSSNVPDDVVYAVTKAVFNELGALQRSVPVLETVVKESMLEGLTAPIHPGAARYYKEIGLQAPSPRPSARDISFSWDASTSPNVSGYRIHYGVSSGKYENTVLVGNQTSHTLTGLEAGQTYYIAITTVEAGGRGESDFSDEVVVKVPQ